MSVNFAFSASFVMSTLCLLTFDFTTVHLSTIKVIPQYCISHPTAHNFTRG